MTQATTVTAALIVKDEAARLPVLLPRLDWADELVVVDSQSTDGSVALAERFGARVAIHPFDTFARQRNRAIDLATSDWVFSIDADETPSEQLVPEIRDAIRSPRHVAYHVPIRSRIFGQPVRRCGTQDDRPVRLFRRGAARWEGEVHERLRVDGHVGRLGAWLEHETLPDLAAFLTKMHRYTRLEAEARTLAGVAPKPWDAWYRPAREVFRRLIYKRGLLDGPTGWKFCLLSGLSEWVLARSHRRHWETRRPGIPLKCHETASPWSQESSPTTEKRTHAA